MSFTGVEPSEKIPCISTIKIIKEPCSKNIKKYGDSNKQCNYFQIIRKLLAIQSQQRMMWKETKKHRRNCVLCEVQPVNNEAVAFSKRNVGVVISVSLHIHTQMHYIPTVSAGTG